MSRRAFFALIVLAACPLAANPPDAEDELVHTEQLLRTLSELKAQVGEIQAKIDELTRQLSERRGALANRPAPPAPPFGGVLQRQNGLPDLPDAKPALRRCAAITREGERCSRSALPNSRYCKQHALAKMK